MGAWVAQCVKKTGGGGGGCTPFTCVWQVQRGHAHESPSASQSTGAGCASPVKMKTCMGRLSSTFHLWLPRTHDLGWRNRVDTACPRRPISVTGPARGVARDTWVEGILPGSCLHLLSGQRHVCWAEKRNLHEKLASGALPQQQLALYSSPEG